MHIRYSDSGKKELIRKMHFERIQGHCIAPCYQPHCMQQQTYHKIEIANKNAARFALNPHLVFHAEVRFNLPPLAIKMNITHAVMQLHVGCITAINPFFVFEWNMLDNNNLCLGSLYSFACIPHYFMTIDTPVFCCSNKLFNNLIMRSTDEILIFL